MPTEVRDTAAGFGVGYAEKCGKGGAEDGRCQLVAAAPQVAQRSEQRRNASLGYELNGVFRDLSGERVRRPICEGDKPAQRGSRSRTPMSSIA
jgi:hypothetical protein